MQQGECINMFSSNSLYITNIFKDKAKNLFNNANLKKLDKNEIQVIFNITIYSEKKYQILPKKYQEMIKEYINGLIEGSV